jgi:hypothetical protein
MRYIVVKVTIGALRIFLRGGGGGVDPEDVYNLRLIF